MLMSVGSVLAGSAAAGFHGNFELLPAVMCLVFAYFAQLSGNYYMRLHDKDLNLGGLIDRQINNIAPSVDPVFLKAAVSGTALVALMAGFALTAMGGFRIIPFGLIIFIMIWLSISGPKPLIRSRYSCLPTFFIFGPLCVIPTSFIQSSHEATSSTIWFDIWPAIIASIVVGLLAANCSLCISYTLVNDHLRNSRKTFTTTYGRKATRNFFLFSTILIALIPICRLLFIDEEKYYIELAAIAIVTVINFLIWGKMGKDSGKADNRIIKYACFNMFLFGLLRFIIYLILGVPDDSHLHYFTTL